MRLRALLVIVAIGAIAVPVAAQQTVILVRHAERADGGMGVADPKTGAPPDPSLSAIGEARAARLATMLSDAGIKAIVTSEYKRTRETAQPLATKLGLQIQAIPSKDYAAVVAKLKAAHAKDTVLIVGHSNTIPEIVKAFGGPEFKMADDEYSGIYILTPATGTMTVIRY